MAAVRTPLTLAALLQLALVGAGFVQALDWVVRFPWAYVGGPVAYVIHLLSIGYALVSGLLLIVSVQLWRRRRWAWRISWTVARLIAVVLLVVPLIGIVEAPRGAPLIAPLRMLAWAGPALLLAALLGAARRAVEP
jgi:hypothetical protein